MGDLRLDLDGIRARFGAPEPARHAGLPGLSGVLLPLFGEGARLSLLYEKRADDMRSHPGEVAFPGGRVDPTDASPLEAALRETEEEVGVDRRRVAVLGHLTDYLTFRGNHVCAYVGHVDGAPPTQPASREVAHVFAVPLADLLDPASYESRALPGGLHRVHYFHVKPYTVWGITGELTVQFLQRAVGWEPPAKVRTILNPRDYRP